MSVDQVASSQSAAAASPPVRARQPEPAQQAQEVQKSGSGNRENAERKTEESARANAEQNRPSVNTSGQTVGQKVNTMA